jgi:hypothetical protein
MPSAGEDETDSDDEEDPNNGPSQLSTKLPGIEVRTALDDAGPAELEAVHRRQLEWALEHAEEAKEATRM